MEVLNMVLLWGFPAIFIEDMLFVGFVGDYYIDDDTLFVEC